MKRNIKRNINEKATINESPSTICLANYIRRLSRPDADVDKILRWAQWDVDSGNLAPEDYKRLITFWLPKDYKATHALSESIDYLDKATPYMLRNDGELFKCPDDIHPYIIRYSDIENDINSLLNESINDLKFIYDHTNNDETKDYIRIIVKSAYQSDRYMVDKFDMIDYFEYFDITDKTYTTSGKELETFVVGLNDLVNQEFCRVRTSDLKYGGYSDDIYFRISSVGFNWFDIIWNTVMRYKNSISTITVSKDNSARDFGDYGVYKINGQELDHMPINDFLTLRGNPIIEDYKFDDKHFNVVLNGLHKGKQLTELLNLHPIKLHYIYEAIKDKQLPYDMDIKSNNKLNEAGYYGWSMSNNAMDAYDEGRKPISQFTTSDLSDFNDRLKELGINTSVKTLKVFRELLKTYGNTGEWHHTGKMYNETSFYDPEEILSKIEDEEIGEKEIIEFNNTKPEKKEKPQEKKWIADFEYLTWGGTRAHPKPYENNLTNVLVIEKGNWYDVYDKTGRKIVRKNKDSNGTYIDKKQEFNGEIEDFVKEYNK